MRRVLISVLTLAFGSVPGAGLVWSSELPLLRVGLLTDGPFVREHNFVELFKSEMQSIAAGAYAVEFAEPSDAGWRPDLITATVDQVLDRQVNAFFINALQARRTCDLPNPCAVELGRRRHVIGSPKCENWSGKYRTGTNRSRI